MVHFRFGQIRLPDTCESALNIYYHLIYIYGTYIYGDQALWT